MNSLGLDPKITLAVYIGAAVLFVIAMIALFTYTRRMKIDKNAPDREEQIARATEKGKKY